MNRCKENKLVKKGTYCKESGDGYGKILKNDVKNYLHLENNVLVWEKINVGGGLMINQ